MPVVPPPLMPESIPTNYRQGAGIPFRHFHRAFVISLGVILASRLLLAIFGHELAGDDGARYLQEGINLAQHGVFSHQMGAPPPPTAHDLPLYPLLLAGIHQFAGDPAVTARIAAVINALLFSLASVGIYLLGKSLIGSRRAGLWAMWIFALLPETIPYSIFHMPESLFLVFFVWSQWFLVCYMRQHAYRNLACSFVLLGLSILTKPITLFYPILASLFAIVFTRPNGAQGCPDRERPVAPLTLRGRVIASFGGLAILLVVLSPWVVRNQTVFGVPGLSTITGTNLYDYNYLYLLEDQMGTRAAQVFEENRTRVLAALPAGEENLFVRSQALGSAAKREILGQLPAYVATATKRHPRLYAGTGNVAFLKLIGSPEGEASYLVTSKEAKSRKVSNLPTTALVAQIIAWLLLLATYCFVGLGLWTIFWRRDWLLLALTAGTVCYFAVLIGPVTATRYRVAMSAPLALAAAVGCQRFFSRRARREPAASSPEITFPSSNPS